MADFFKFAWLCIRHAWRGCWTRANEWGSVLGGAVLFLILYFSRHRLEQLKFIEAPSTYWGVAGYAFVLAVCSVCTSFLIIFLSRLTATPARLYWEQYRKSESLAAELATAKSTHSGDDTGPNWPIHELFSYLEPNVLDRPEDRLWEKAGEQIRDALSVGRLRIWGRLSKTNLGSWVGERAALRLIDRAYWEKAFFTYMFFDASAQDQTHCFADRASGVPAYTDLQVNRAEALKVWPGEPDDLAESYPNVRLADSPPALALFEGSERPKLIALLKSEKLASWAQPMSTLSNDHVRLNGSDWEEVSMRFEPKTSDLGSINQTYLRDRGASSATYYDVCLNYAQLKKAWPRLGVQRSKCDVQ